MVMSVVGMMRMKGFSLGLVGLLPGVGLESGLSPVLVFVVGLVFIPEIGRFEVSGFSLVPV